MNKICRIAGLITVLVLGLFFAASAASAQCQNPVGDINNSGKTDVVDVQCGILTALWVLSGPIGPSPDCIGIAPLVADVSCDGNINVVDVQLIIKIGIGDTLSTDIDANQNLCPDACENADDLCGNGSCVGAAGETCVSCPIDCGLCAGDCCEAHTNPGCNNPDIQNCVCDADPFCCEVSWDSNCVAGIELHVCGTCQEDTGCCTGHSTPGCGIAACEDCVCSLEPFCCEIAWDAECVFVVAGACQGACPCAKDNACCKPHGVPGCADDNIEACVCNLDPICCFGPWNSACVDLAKTECSLDCEENTNCCTPSAIPGCAQPNCQNCVCTTDALCCAVAWDNDCVQIASTTCGVTCGCGFTDECCAIHPSPGCDDADCESCVCVHDELCCTTVWDEGCVALGFTDCILPCGCTPPVPDCCTTPSPLPGCNSEGLCQECVCKIDPSCCNIAWDDQCVVLANAACTTACACPVGDDACCLPHAAPGCGAPSCADCICRDDSFCCTVTWDNSCVAKGGAECSPLCNCTPSAAPCCTPRTTPGCDSPSCTQCVCAADPFCCEVAWGGSCVSLAAESCAAECGCTASNCCSLPSNTPGCLSPDCSACVCASDPYCCAVAFDAQCVSDANGPCGSACGCITGSACCNQTNLVGGCGDDVCEPCVCNLDPFCCTTAWTQDCVQLANETCNLACSCDVGPVDCCIGGSTPGCNNPTCESCVCDLDPFCCSAGWDEVCVEEATLDCPAACGCNF